MIGGPRLVAQFAIELAIACAVWSAIAFAGIYLSGCGSTVGTHARIATVATVALEGADRAYDDAVRASMSACHDEACVSRVEADAAPAAGALDAVAASLQAYAEALELAMAADDGPSLGQALGVALGRLAGVWERLRAALGGMGVDVPALPGGAS